MRPSRKHAEILIASLVLVGCWMWTAIIAHRTLELDRIGRIAVVLTAGFIGAQIARRWLVTLAAGELAISALLACAAGIGAVAHHAVVSPCIGRRAI